MTLGRTRSFSSTVSEIKFLPTWQVGAKQDLHNLEKERWVYLGRAEEWCMVVKEGL